jgi:TonB-dependent receptor
MTVSKQSKRAIVTAVSLALGTWQATAAAQQDVDDAVAPDDGTIEEVVVTGRTISATQELINERLTDANVIDTLGADAITRLGDTTVGQVLRRLPGLTLVQDRFVYIRGLGERYSSSLLNGARIPSPDLTRNVIPLDIFPTAVVQSLRVQKSWEPSLPANFAGGNVDIRTRSIPDGFWFNVELQTAYNSLSSDNGLTYQGGGDDNLGTDDGTRAVSQELLRGVAGFQGSTGVQDILTYLQRQDPTATVEDAELVNRQLGAQLNRNYATQSKSMPLDLNGKISIGNTWLVGNDWEIGGLVGANYQQQWRRTTAVSTNFSFPDERTDTEQETTHSVNITGTGALGARYMEEHEFFVDYLWLRNTDDETAIRDFFNENREISDGLGFRNRRFEFEERQMTALQFRGSHELGPNTRDRFGFVDSLVGWLPDRTSIDWYYSDSESTTDIPNRLEVQSGTVTDPVTRAVRSEEVNLNSQAADFRFTELGDEVQDYGWSFTLPVEFASSYVEFSGGANHARKARTYSQVQYTLGALEVSDPDILVGPINEVFSDANILDPANNFVFQRQATNTESYLAATMTDAAFGYVDWTVNDTWRFAGGARWENYKQVAVEWNPLGFTQNAPQINPCNIIDPCDFITNDDDTRQFESDVAFQDDKFYPAASVTYMSEFWAETFQLRFGWSETAIRPDLREITGSSYIDPITDDLTRGNPGVIPAEVVNYDIRAEWFFEGGDNFTVSLFRKEIDNPIEFFESPVSDTKTAREIINAQSAEVQGVEIEALKELGFLGGFFDAFFVQGNVTIQDSELVAGPNANAPTNQVRQLAGASDWVANLFLGYDSANAQHTASLIYNTFGERLYVAGRNGAPDSFEQPFNSLDFNYSWFPTDTLTFRFKATNLLDDAIEIERAGVTVFNEEPGTTFSVSFQYTMR